eukprot:1186357-Prorocentrum_minimum.AAC.2
MASLVASPGRYIDFSLQLAEASSVWHVLIAGATPGEWMRLVFQGLFLAPQMVGEARKGGLLVAEVMRRQGYPTRAPDTDVVCAVTLGREDLLLAFCKSLMSTRLVDT